MKSIASLSLVVAALLLLSAPSSEARRKHRRNYRRNIVHENFEIYNPKGLTIWYPKSRELVGFGVEVFLNQRRGYEQLHCDICLNTTTSSYGKYIIHDDNAVIRAGDILKYRFLLQMSNGTVFEVGSEFHVAANKIFRRRDECQSTATTSTTEIDVPKPSLEEDINLLESIVYDVFQHCNNVTEISKNLYLDSRPQASFDPKKLYEYTLNELQNKLPKINWNTVLVSAYYYNDGVGFEVRTLIDKLKVLQLTKGLNQSAVSDFDDLEQSTDGPYSDEDYNDLSFHDVKVARERF